MGKYRKKPVEVEAEQYTGARPWPAGVCFCEGDRSRGQFSLGKAHVHTLERVLYPKRGDWIVQGTKGEHWPVKPDIFEATYEPVGPGTHGGEGATG